QRLLGHFTTNVMESSGAITHDSSGPFWVRVLCDTTGGAPVYIISNFMGVNGITTNAFTGLVAGSTALS
ncbi:unnamed protein product, partial [marine sediment metagenome]